jgi:hypothetical protein
VNLYSPADPFLSIGSIVESNGAHRVLWRITVADAEASGEARDLKSAARIIERRYGASERSGAQLAA